MTLESVSYRLGCIIIILKKILVFRMDFNEFIRGLDGFDIISASHWGDIGSMKVACEAS